MTEVMDIITNCVQTTPCSRRCLDSLSSQRNTPHEAKFTAQRPRPRPGRRRRGGLGKSATTWNQRWILSMLVLAILLTDVEAVGRRKKFGRFARNEEIIFDRSTPPRTDLHRRGDLFQTTPTSGATQAAKTSAGSMTVDSMRPKFSSAATAVASTATGLSSIVAPSGATINSASSAATSIISAPAGSSVPKAFDGGLGRNFTAPSCPLFLNSFLNNETFTDCVPFSLYLQVSTVQLYTTKLYLIRNIDIHVLLRRIQILLLHLQSP